MLRSATSVQSGSRHGADNAAQRGATRPPRAIAGAQDVLALQELAGNRQVQRLLAGPTAQRSAGPPFPPVIQRGGMTTEDAELVGEQLGHMVLGGGQLLLGIWGFFARLLGRGRQVAGQQQTPPQLPPPQLPPPQQQAPDQQPDLSEKPGQSDDLPLEVPGVVEQSDESGGELPGSESGALVPSTGRQSLPVLQLTQSDWDFLIGRIIRQDLWANEILLDSLSRLTMTRAITTYSPDLALVKRQHDQRMEEERWRLDQARAEALELQRKLKACQEIYRNLLGSLESLGPSPSMGGFRALAFDLRRFVAEQGLGSELTMVSERIAEGAQHITFKKFAISPKLAAGIKDAPNLLKALERLADAVEDKLIEQQKQAEASRRPTKWERQTAERWEKKKLKSEVVEEERTTTTSEEVEPEPEKRPPPPPFSLIGKYLENDVWARIDWYAIDQVTHHAVRTMKKNPDYRNIYDKAMRNAVMPASSTGVDCTKPEGDKRWVVKVSYPTAEEHDHIDNRLSPMAIEVRDGNRIYLDFNQIVFRH